MEKIKIKSVTERSKDDKKYAIIETEDGRKGASFDTAFLSFAPGTEVECEVKEGKEYQGKKQYILSLPKLENKKQFPQRDYRFEKRKAALELSVESIKHLDKTVSCENVLAVAEKYHEFLNK